MIALIVLGIAGEISLANLLVGLGRAAMRSRPEQWAELREIPWMKGLRSLPTPVVPLAAAFGGAVEEVVFRGVLLRILTDRLAAPPLAAIAIAGGLFCVQQWIQVRTPFQAMVIGGGCIAISLVGGLLVALTGSMVPAVLCHASFVIFFMPGGTASASGTSRSYSEAAR
jgi:membrane protease YdiL (CAAX protease family)